MTAPTEAASDVDDAQVTVWAGELVGPDLPALPPGMHSSMEVRTQTVTRTVFEARVTLRHRDGRKVQACGTADSDRAAQAAAIAAGLQQLGEGDADG